MRGGNSEELKLPQQYYCIPEKGESENESSAPFLLYSPSAELLPVRQQAGVVERV